jgi:hypothetical protein
MYFDNRLFRVNGEGLDGLKTALKLVFNQAKDQKAVGWKITPLHGFILYGPVGDHKEGVNAFPGAGLQFEQAADIIWEWLQQDATWRDNVFREWEQDLEDSDVSNARGWIVYCNDWGHVELLSSAICAIKPCHLWTGK